MVACCKLQSLLVSEMRAAEKRYFADLGQTLLSPDLNPQRWWSLAKRACGWSSSRQIPALLDTTRKLVTSPLEQATTLNNQFSRQCSASPSADACPVNCSAMSTFQFSTVAPEAVLTKLRNLPSGKSSGSDSVTNELLKLACTCSPVCDSLASLFNRSLAEGVFPDTRKKAVISPILRCSSFS